MPIGCPPHQCRTRRNSRGLGQEAGAPAVCLTNASPNVRLTNAMLNVQKAARAYGADDCVPANKKILTVVRPPRNLIPASLLRPILLFPGWPRKAVPFRRR